MPNEIIDAMERYAGGRSRTIIRVVGVPGSGKTQRVAEYLLHRRNQGIGWDQMVSLSYSRAAGTACRRRLEALGAPESEVKKYKTLHSRCYHLLDLSKTDIMKPKDYAEFMDSEKMDFTSANIREIDDETSSSFLESGRRLGDRYLRADDLIRTSLGKVSEVKLMSLFGDDGSATIKEIKRFSDRLRDFKRKKGKLDFTDMLEEVVREEKYPESLRVLAVDEAQDLSSLQIKVLRDWANNAGTDEVVILGDDDQSLYQFAGASSHWFAHLKNASATITLDLSHRLPEKILRAAESVIRQNKDRLPKTMRALKPDGRVEMIPDPDKAFTRARELAGNQTVYVLTRTKYKLWELFESQLRAGITPYTFLGKEKSFWDSPFKYAVANLLKCKETKYISPMELQVVLQYVFADRLTRGNKSRVDEMVRMGEMRDLKIENMKKEEWGNPGKTLGDALETIPVHELLEKNVNPDHLKKFVTRAQTHGIASLFQPPKVSLGTKHSSKGLETGTVVVVEDEDFSQDSIEEIEAERRVVYVARTRASENLIIVPMPR